MTQSAGAAATFADTPILVIKLGALGDVVQALGPFAAIRAHHPHAAITLLTTRPFAEFAESCPYFDDVWIDERPRLHRVPTWLALRHRLRRQGFQRVYDLQTSDRSAFYFRLFWPGPYPEWSGIARGCSHPHANPQRDLMHTVDRQAEQLRMAGIDHIPPPDLSWARFDESDGWRVRLRPPYALLAVGSAPHRPDKRWPLECFAGSANRLAARGLQPVLVGAAWERHLHEAIMALCPAAMSLAGETSLTGLAALARGAAIAVGNDTGPMHMAAAAACPCVVLFSHASDPALCGPRGETVRYIRQPRLSDVTVDEVMEAVAARARTNSAFAPA